MCVIIQERHKWQTSSLKRSIRASYRLVFYGLCKDEREKLGEKQQKARHQVILHNTTTYCNPHGLGAGRRLGNECPPRHLAGGAHCPGSRVSAPQPGPPIPSFSCIPLELGVTTALLPCCWLTNWYSLQISVRYCLKMQLLMPRTWSARVLPEGHPRWSASLLSGPTVRQREEILTEVVQEKMFISVRWISKHPSFEVENHKWRSQPALI